jgi:hypothetical protein
MATPTILAGVLSNAEREHVYWAKLYSGEGEVTCNEDGSVITLDATAQKEFLALFDRYANAEFGQPSTPGKGC